MEVKNEMTKTKGEKFKEFMKENSGIIIVSALSVAMVCKLGYNTGHKRGFRDGKNNILDTIASSDGIRLAKDGVGTYLFKATKIIKEQMDKN